MTLKNNGKCWWFEDKLKGKTIYSQHFTSKKYANEAKKENCMEKRLICWGYNNRCSGCGEN